MISKSEQKQQEILRYAQDDSSWCHPERSEGSLKIVNLFLLISSIAALCFAYISQYVFDMQPCVLCFYQRKPFFAIIALTSLTLIFFKSEKFKKISIYLCALLLLINIGIASYHVGVENKIFKGPTTCSASQNLNEITDLEELKIAINNTKAIKCDEPAFIFLGVSMAGWNVIYCLGLIFVIGFFLKRAIPQ
ncbi:MAG: disulfide bond formation protein B [Rickettsiales bacterium]|nr:disulfide bond formation protein B [Rickettsiales bacterium]